ncbi:endonuclease 8-like 3 isoform X1 [Hemitrygon akajei]|uniref:endonuclease 8-like 3 isoform X1 n=2 Tax=Hemitrygon akajei TaxID=2704970 RepID=UPI003BF9D2CD
MVEGPGCALNGERIRSRVRTGQRLVGLRGSAVTQLSGRNDSCLQAIELLKGKIYTGVKTLGKELFIYFEKTELRIHFGMNGSMRINSSERKHSSGAPAVLEIQLTSDFICFFESTFDIRSTSECEEKVKMMEELDICSVKFSCSRAEEELKRHGPRMICDVLLDQAVLPGVGNIIKNESIFDSCLHPAIKICQLSAEQIRHLVRVTRDFTILFCTCRKIGSALYKHFRVYKRSTCRQCNGKIIVCRLGENNRMTYFCSHCQTEDPSQVNNGNFPKRNSLMSWTQGSRDQSIDDTIAKKEEEEWTCPLCTLVNAPSSKSCDACLTQRLVKAASPQKSGFDTNLIKYQCNSFGKPLIEWKLNRKAAFGTTTLVLTSQRSSQKSPTFSFSADNEVKGNPLLTDGNPSPALFKKCPASALNSNILIKSSFNNYVDQPTNNSTLFSYTNQSLFCHPPKRLKKDHSSFDSNTNTAVSVFRDSNNVDGDNSPPSSPKFPCCQKHGRPCTLRVVKKEGNNKGRQFYACSMAQAQQCDYFQWADLHFPICNHGRRCIMRTVLKLGPNNGRNFYVCSQSMDKQCNFFQWAESGPGIKSTPDY